MNSRGIGLGLVISSRIVEMFSGEITVYSQEGLGSKFTFNVQVNDDDELQFVDNDIDIDKNIIAQDRD